MATQNTVIPRTHRKTSGNTLNLVRSRAIFDVPRGRAEAALARALANRLVIVRAPAGWGKTTLIKHASNTATVPFAYLELRADRSFSRFVDDLSKEVQKVGGDLGMSRSLFGVSAAAAAENAGIQNIAAWFCRRLDTGRTHTIVIDGLDRTSNPSCAEFIEAAIDLSPPQLSWILTERSAGSCGIHKRTAAIVDQDDLALDFDTLRSMRSLTERNISDGLLVGIIRKAEHSIAKAAFLLQVDHHESTFDLTLTNYMQDLSDDERTAGMASIMIDRSSQTDSSHTNPAISAILSRMNAITPHLFEPSGKTLQACVAERLIEDLETLDVNAQNQILARTADFLDHAGNVMAAVSLHQMAHNYPAIINIIERKALQSLEDEHLHIVVDALRSLPSTMIHGRPLIEGMYAMAEGLAGRFERANSLFADALRHAHGTHYDYRIRYWYGCLMVRENNPELTQLLKPCAQLFHAPPEIRIAIMAMLATAYSTSDQQHRANHWISRALRAAKRISSQPLNARVSHQAAVIEAANGNFKRATEHAKLAIINADYCGWSQLTAASTSILYMAATHQGDWDEALLQAQNIARHAENAGDPTRKFYAIAAAFESEVEAGHVEAATQRHADIEMFRHHYPSSYAADKIASIVAMTKAWDGNFQEAYSILANALENTERLAQNAQILAEAALYANAIGLDLTCSDLLHAGLRSLTNIQSDQNDQRGLLMLCLVMIFREEHAEAQKHLNNLCSATVLTERLSMLANVIRTLAGGESESQARHTIAAALQKFADVRWLGVRQMLDVLISHYFKNRERRVLEEAV